MQSCLFSEFQPGQDFAVISLCASIHLSLQCGYPEHTGTKRRGRNESTVVLLYGLKGKWRDDFSGTVLSGGGSCILAAWVVPVKAGVKSKKIY